MALPDEQKTWQHVVNTAAYTATADLWYDIKNILCTMASFPWTVVRSCNNVVADANDNWNSPSDVRWNSSSGQIDSWIVLEQAGIPGAVNNFQVCIVTETNTVYSVRGGMRYYISPSAGFTGGSTSSRPTATDEIELPPEDTYNQRTVYDWTNTTGQPALRLHVSQSTDGECTRLVFYVNSEVQRLLMFEKPKNPIAGWTYPHFALNCNTNGNAPNYGKLNAGTGSGSIVNPSGGRASVALAGEGNGTGPIPESHTYVSDFDGAYPLCPVGLYSRTTGARGRVGELFDCYWGAASLSNGTHYPADASRLWVQHRDLVLPWNGGTACLIN